MSRRADWVEEDAGMASDEGGQVRRGPSVPDGRVMARTECHLPRTIRGVVCRTCGYTFRNESIGADIEVRTGVKRIKRPAVTVLGVCAPIERGRSG